MQVAKNLREFFYNLYNNEIDFKKQINICKRQILHREEEARVVNTKILSRTVDL